MRNFRSVCSLLILCVPLVCLSACDERSQDSAIPPDATIEIWEPPYTARQLEAKELWDATRNPKPVALLPDHVVAPRDKLAMYADFDDRRGDNIVMYLVNKTSRPISFNSQDGEIPLTLEFRNSSRKWKSAQVHRISRCGNSFYKVTLDPGMYFMIAGYAPRSGIPHEVRYHKFLSSTAGDLISNVGIGNVQELDVKFAALEEEMNAKGR